ncbi:hypothetical protein ACT009_09955 [Sphingomonas sp. Tas61C01]|uniref:hypothetical protein n=1 Tax=Sphingomonas sp. Tas61C01 TaxID=3458297 RepID=UPI00403E5A56
MANVLVPFAGINGNFNIDTDIGYTLAPYNGASSNGITVTSTNASTGLDTATITRDNNRDLGESDARGFAVNGGDRTLTKFKMKDPSVTGDTWPGWLSDSAFGRRMRDLDLCNANSTPLQGYYDIDFYDLVTVPLRGFRDKHAIDPNFKIYHHVFMLTATDAYVTREAQIFRDNFPDNNVAKAILELSNEVWSDGFPARWRTFIEGAKQGFVDGTPAAPGIKYPVVKVPTTSNNLGGSPALNAGDCVLGNFQGGNPGLGSYNLVRALKPIAAGTDIKLGTGDFELIAGLAPLLNAGLLYEGYRHNQIIEIFRSVLGNERYERQFLPAIYTQVGNKIAPREIIRLDGTPGYRQKVKILGSSTYLHHPGTLYKAESGLTPQILADGFLARIPIARQAIIDHIAEMRTLGPFQFGFYEGGMHPMYYKPGCTEHYKQVQDQLERSTLMRAVEYDFQMMIQEVASGYGFYYTGVMFQWGLKRYGKAPTQSRYEGHMAARNNQARPAYA